jgi:excisionase family DNA binding protein
LRTIPERKTYRVAEFMEAFRIGHSKVYTMIKSGELKTVKIGKTRLILAESADKLLEPDSAA